MKHLRRTFACLLCVCLLSAGCAKQDEQKDNTEQTTTVAPGGTDPVQEAPVSMRAGGKVRVISYNLDADLSTASKRSKGMSSILLSYDPDSIGVQEARPVWVAKFKKQLEGYDYIGVSADGERPTDTTFGTYIYYKKDKYNVVDSGTFWLSTTPDVPSRYSNTVDCNRTCCWVILEDKETGFRYVHMNSHLDWMDEAATMYQIELIQKQIRIFEDMGLPVFATGDYNTDEGTDIYQRMLADDTIGDAKFLTDDASTIGTYPHYDDYDVTTQKPIDFCFVTKNTMTVQRYHVMDDKYNDSYVSDHFGLCIDAEVPELPDLEQAAAAPVMSALKLGDVGENSLEVSFDAASVSSAAPVVAYHLSVLDADGNVVSEESISSQFRAPDAPESFSYRAVGLNAKSTYTIRVEAVDLYGKASAPAEISGETSEAAKPEAYTEADILDLKLSDDGWSDVSAAAHEIKTVGSPELTKHGSANENALHFTRNNGNLAVQGFKDDYAALGKSFTMELDVELSNISKYQSLMSNMHAGGFGFEVSEDGQLRFGLHCGGSYQYVACPVEKDVRLHAVAVYDGETLTLYVNNRYASQTTDQKNVGAVSSFATESGAQYLCIGADSDASGKGEYPAEAYIYGARIYSYAATPGQALQMYYDAHENYLMHLNG